MGIWSLLKLFKDDIHFGYKQKFLNIPLVRTCDRVVFFPFLFQFCDVAIRIFSHIWLETSYESKIFIKIFLYPVYLLEKFCRKHGEFEKGNRN
jgi:hypothetical protein